MEKASLLFLKVARLGYPSLKSLTGDQSVEYIRGEVDGDDTDMIGS